MRGYLSHADYVCDVLKFNLKYLHDNFVFLEG